MIPALAVVAIFLLCCSLARELTRDFYRPWLEARHAAERVEQRELTTWLAALRAVQVSACAAAYSMQQMTDAMHQVGVAYSALITIPTGEETE